MSGITSAWSEKLAEYVAAVEADYLHRTDERRWKLMEEFTQEFLIKDYPVLLSNVRCGVSVQPGWGMLVHNLCSDITMVMAANSNLKVKVEQVKQKLGSLRFYASVYTNATIIDDLVTKVEVAPEHMVAREKIRALIQKAEADSTFTCEVCGAPGNIVNLSGWLQASCKKHGKP